MLIRISAKLIVITAIVFLHGSLLSKSGNDLDSIRFTKMIARDTNFLLENLDDSLLYIHSNGLMESKAEHIRNISEGKLVYQSMKSQGVHYISTEDYLIGRGSVNVAGIVQGNAFEVSLRYSTIYRRVKGIYKLLYWQSTKMK